MKKAIFTASAVAFCGVIAATSASASTLTTLVTPDQLFLESSGNRANGAASGDIGSTALGTISGPAERITGIAGRIVSATDVFTFTSRSVFDMHFANLAFPSGTDIDGCAGFDSSDCSKNSLENGVIDAIFKLSGVGAVTFTSPQTAGTPIFSNVAAGSYTFTIDGKSGGSLGSAYDVAITTTPVPVPAALPLLLSAFGAAGFFARRKRG